VPGIGPMKLKSAFVKKAELVFLSRKLGGRWAMNYVLLIYIIALVRINLLLVRRIKKTSGVVMRSVVESAVAAAGFCALNYYLNGPDAFMMLAFFILVAIGFVVSLLLGMSVLAYYEYKENKQS